MTDIAKIRKRKDLSENEKALLLEIDRMSANYQICLASVDSTIMRYSRTVSPPIRDCLMEIQAILRGMA